MQAYVWEIEGRVFMGIAESAADDLRRMETAMGCRASRVSTVPESRAIQKHILHMCGETGRIRIHEPFDVGKQFLLSAHDEAPRITPYKRMPGK